MKKIFLFISLMQIFTTNIKSHVVQAHYLKKNDYSVLLYGDYHTFDEETIKNQEEYLEKQILPKSKIQIITEKPLMEIDVLSTIPIFYFLQDKSNKFKNITCIESRTFMHTIVTIGDALRTLGYYSEKTNIEEFKQNDKVKNQPNLQKTIFAFLAEIETVLEDLANEFSEALDTNILPDEEKCVLIKNFDTTKDNILDFINNWNKTFEQNNIQAKPIIQIMLDSFESKSETEINLIEKMKSEIHTKTTLISETEINLVKEIKSEIYTKTAPILDFKLLIEVIKQFKTNKKIAIFAGGNHIDNLIKMLESIGFTIQEEKRNPQKPYIWLNPVDTQTFGWITD